MIQAARAPSGFRFGSLCRKIRDPSCGGYPWMICRLAKRPASSQQIWVTNPRILFARTSALFLSWLSAKLALFFHFTRGRVAPPWQLPFSEGLSVRPNSGGRKRAGLHFVARLARAWPAAGTSVDAVIGPLPQVLAPGRRLRGFRSHDSDSANLRLCPKP